jgi:hypothetical protein
MCRRAGEEAGICKPRPTWELRQRPQQRDPPEGPFGDLSNGDLSKVKCCDTCGFKK